LNISCIIPARNEEGHLKQVLSEVFSISEISDIIIVEGGSTDKTYEVAIEVSSQNPSRVRVIKQSTSGKFNAVLLGVKVAREDLILIWDADGTVPLFDVTKIVKHSVKSGNPVIGDRLRGHRQQGAMQFFNFLGNWLFAIAWAPVLKSKPTDLLCGTKIFNTRVFTKIPPWLLKIDPYGDFSLIATARFYDYSVESIPVNYLARNYGSTNINRWSGGLKLLITSIFVYFWFFKKFKFTFK
jgi:glycosyltransferase involved in cell wall biosynthesis